MRDVRAALKDGEQRSYELAELLIELDELIDPGVEDAEDSAGAELESDVGLHVSGDGSSVVGPDAGHDPDGSAHLVAPAGMAASMVSRAAQLARAGARGTRQPVAGTRRVLRS